MQKAILVLLIFLYACTSKRKEGAELHISNETASDVFITDKFTFDNLGDEKKIEIFTWGIVNENTKNLRPYLKPELITMYTNKSVFISKTDFDNNKRYNSLVFYLVRRKNLGKTKREIVAHKLYDSICIDLNTFHQKGNDNYLRIHSKGSVFNTF